MTIEFNEYLNTREVPEWLLERPNRQTSERNVLRLRRDTYEAAIMRPFEDTELELGHRVALAEASESWLMDRFDYIDMILNVAFGPQPV